MLLSSADFFKTEIFNNFFINVVRVSKGLDLDQPPKSIGHNLALNCLHKGYQQTIKVTACKEIVLLPL